MLKPLLVLISALAILGCATDPPEDRDKIEPAGTVQTSLQVGDTSSLWVVSRTVVQINGRTETENPYTSFELSSSDVTVATVAKGQFLVGVGAGETKVTILDENTDLKSAPITVVVTEKP